MKDLRIKYVIETSYEDSTWWVGYSIGAIHSIALIQAENKLEAINETIAIYDTLSDKKDLEECSDLLKELILECNASDNDMLYVENDDISKEKIDQLQKEVSNLGLENYVDFYTEDETPIIIYGGIATEFKY